MLSRSNNSIITYIGIVLGFLTLAGIGIAALVWAYHLFAN